MLKRSMIATAAILLCLGMAGAAEGDDAIPGAELRKILSGNTVWVIRQDLTKGDEYHLPDGRVFGHNGVEPIDNGCWDIVGNEVCYYYKDDYTKGRAHCWTFKRMGTDRFSLTATGTGFRGIGGMDIGNPRNFSDRGNPWVCRGLLSRGPDSPGWVAALR